MEAASELKVKVYIAKDISKITVGKPKFFADVSIGLFEQNMKVGFESETVSDITVIGDMKFDKVIEQCLLGYNVEIPYGKAFVGVFLVVDLKGQIHVETRVITHGTIEAGFRADAVCFIPYYVGPYAYYKPSSFDVNFTVNGEINAMASVVPQAGLIICDEEIGVLQLWVGMKAHARYTPESIQQITS